MPKTAKEQKTGVILHSDTTQHSHTLVGGKLYALKDKQYAKVTTKAQITHQEHGTIHLTRGVWEIRRQRQYAGKDMTTLVVD